MDVILSKVNTTLLNDITVLDISYYPAKVITSICKQFTQTIGPNSKTLQNLGWYPSGKLVILPYPTKTDSSIDKNDDAEEELLKQFLEWQSRNVLKHEEFAYNNPNAANNMAGVKSDNNNQTTSAGNVQWTGVGVSQQGSILKPSEIFNAVETRADAEIQLEQQQRQANTSNNNKPKKKKKPTEKERAQRLDALLQGIDNNNKGGKKKKKKAVSAKVRQMLLKQRSEGNKKLRMEDRFHLELVRLWDVSGVVDKQSSNDGSTSYKFFSRQSTAGKVASSVASNLGKDISTELLVVYPPLLSGGNETQTEKRYKRLPNTMSLHDAQSAGYVNEFDVVVIRIYALNGTNGDDGPSKSVLEEESDSDNDDMDITEGSNDKEDEVDIDTKPTSMEVDSKSSNAKAPLQQPPQEQSQQDLQQRIQTAFLMVEDSSSNPAKKKKKPVSKQVRSMLIKSKSTGNVRVKPEDRLYLEVILFHDDDQTCSPISKDAVSSSYRFFSEQNDMQHIITVCSTGSNPGKVSDSTQVELIVERPDNNSAAEGSVYKALPKTLKLGDAIQQGYIENFGRVLIRICNNDESYLPCDILQ